MASAASIVAPKRTQAALAREFGVSRQAINDLVKRNIISVDRDGLIDVELARVAVANRIRPSSKTSTALQSSPAPSPAQTAASPADSEDIAVTSYHVAKTLRETAEARRAQLALAREKGAVIEVAAVRNRLAGMLATTRDSLLQIPARLAPVLAAESDASRVHDLLQTELHQALAVIIDAPDRLTGPLGDSDKNQPPAQAGQAQAATETTAP